MDEKVKQKKIEAAMQNDPAPIWDHSLEDAIKRIAEAHAPWFDARDINAFRYICLHARHSKFEEKK